MRRVVLLLLATALITATSQPVGALTREVKENQSFDETGQKAIDTTAQDDGGAWETGRVEGARGTINYSQREVATDRYNMPIYDAPCDAPTGNGTVNTGPRVQQASSDNGNVAFQLAQATQPDRNSSAPTVNTLEFDATNPPEVYFAVCRVNNPDPTDPQVQEDVLAWVKAYFSQTRLPKPAPEISAPNGGICGVIHTVDLHMPTELMHRDTSTPFGTLSLHIYGRVMMNWGDGSRREVHTTGGGPYPYSAIKHSWTDRGFYDINAHADWIANYSLGPYNGVTYSGVLTGISTEGSINDFRVWEAQAMLIK